MPLLSAASTTSSSPCSRGGREQRRRLDSAALHRPRAGHPAAVARGGVRARMPGPRLREPTRSGAQARGGEFALRRGDCAELSPLRGAPCRPHLRGERRADDRAEEVRPHAGHALRDVRGALDPRVRPRPRDPRLEHRRRRRRPASLEGVLPSAAREGARSSRRRATRGGERATRRALRDDDATRSRCSPTASRHATSRSTRRSSTTARRRCSTRSRARGPRRKRSTCRTSARRSVHARVREAVEKLDPRERFIVEVRMMADRADELSLAEIGRRLGRLARARASARGAREAKAPQAPRDPRGRALQRGLTARSVPDGHPVLRVQSQQPMGRDDIRLVWRPRSRSRWSAVGTEARAEELRTLTLEPSPETRARGSRIRCLVTTGVVIFAFRTGSRRSRRAASDVSADKWLYAAGRRSLGRPHRAPDLHHSSTCKGDLGPAALPLVLAGIGQAAGVGHPHQGADRPARQGRCAVAEQERVTSTPTTYAGGGGRGDAGV